MQIDVQKLTEILDEQRVVFKTNVEEFVREVGVMFEHTNSKIEFIAEKIIGIEEKIDAKVEDQDLINKGFNKRITKLEFQMGK